MYPSPTHRFFLKTESASTCMRDSTIFAYLCVHVIIQIWRQIHYKVFELQTQILFQLQNITTNTNKNFFIVFEIQLQNTSNVFPTTYTFTLIHHILWFSVLHNQCNTENHKI